jgi:hypothetical protein
MSWRTSLAGLLAGLATLSQLPEVPPLVRVVALVVGAVAVAVLGVLARDHATPPPSVAPLDVAQVRAEIAHVLASMATVRESDPPVSPSVVRGAVERVLVGSDRPGSTPVSVAKGEP